MDYKKTPIIIMNRDRLYPLQELINTLLKRKYDNIIVFDNGSTYTPLLEWYNQNTNIDIFYNNGLVDNDIQSLNKLINSGNKKFNDLISQEYIFTDSDCVPIDCIPDNFVEVMLEYNAKYKQKIALGIKIDDINSLNPNPTHPLIQEGINIEKKFWGNITVEKKCLLYHYPIDTTFSLYSKNTPPVWAYGYRMGDPYLIRHFPFYYDVDNLPDDELYYLQHLNKNSGVNWSLQLRNKIDNER